MYYLYLNKNVKSKKINFKEVFFRKLEIEKYSCISAKLSPRFFPINQIISETANWAILNHIRF